MSRSALGNLSLGLGYKDFKANVELRFLEAANIQTYGDPIKFSQIITNLITNAIDAYGDIEEFGKTREALVNLCLEAGFIRLAVQDWGKGIAPEHTNKIFEPFFTTKTAGQDLGIGLSIVKNIVEKDFQGKIGMQSKPGQGAIFTVQFPQKQKPILYANNKF